MDTGRPPAYKTAKEMQAVFDKYLQECIEKDKRPTISKAAFVLGFESRQSFYDYEKKPDFSYTVKRIRLFIESVYEENIEKGAGFIFALKNFGWTDSQKIELSNDLDSLTEEQIEQKIAELQRKAGTSQITGRKTKENGEE